MTERKTNNRKENESDYSVKEWIEEGFKNIDEKLVRIESQVIKTNGRVTKLEFWRMLLVGAYTLSTVLVPIIYYMSIQNLDYKIRFAVDDALDQRASSITYEK